MEMNVFVKVFTQFKLNFTFWIKFYYMIMFAFVIENQGYVSVQYKSFYLSISLSLYIYMYVCMYVYVYMYIAFI